MERTTTVFYQRGLEKMEIWCEKFGYYRDFLLGYCGDVTNCEDCRSCPANELKGKKKEVV